MAFNYRCGLVDTVELISEDVLLVDHHSVLHTLIVGMFIRVGRILFNSDNIGFFLYTTFQMVFTAWVLVHALYKLKGYGVGERIRIVMTVFLFVSVDTQICCYYHEGYAVC